MSEELTKEIAAAAVETYETLLAYAIEIVGGHPYNEYVSNDEFARLTIDGDTATLYWLDVSGDYDGGYQVNTEKTDFPASLLLLSQEDFDAWRAAEKAKYEREERERENARKAAEAVIRERDERRALAALKAKYEKP